VSHPEFEDGVYWIDPNQGSHVDAIEVYCHMKTHQTCVYAKPSQVFKASWYSGPNKYVWFGEDMENGFQFTYKADRVQMTFLQLLSSEAYQNITYHCQNSAAYYNMETQSKDNAIKFMTSNDLELEANHRKFSYSVQHDECQFKQAKWASTVFEFKTTKARRMPIVDIAPFDIGGADQSFGLEIGPVCFS